jgi:hypothetical protein
MLHELAKQLNITFADLNATSVKKAFLINGGCVDPAGIFFFCAHALLFRFFARRTFFSFWPLASL